LRDIKFINAEGVLNRKILGKKAI